MFHVSSSLLSRLGISERFLFFPRFAVAHMGLPTIRRRLNSSRSAQTWNFPLIVESANIRAGRALSHKHLVLLCSSNRSNSSKNLLQSDNTYIPPERRWYKLPVPSHSPELTKELWQQKPRVNIFEECARELLLSELRSKIDFARPQAPYYYHTWLSTNDLDACI